MSNEMAPECLKHKDNRHVQVRLDYMLIFRNESKAKIIRVMESWTDTKYAEWYKGTADSKEQKSEPPVEDLWITMSYDQFSIYVYGTIKHDTIKQQVDDLVASKHLQRRVHPVYPYGPPQYLLNRELLQKSLDELEIPASLFDLGDIVPSPRKKHTPTERYPQGRGKKPTRDPGKIPPPTGETSHPSNNSTKNTENPSKNEETYTAPSLPTNVSASASASATHTPSLYDAEALGRRIYEAGSQDPATLPPVMSTASQANPSIPIASTAATPGQSDGYQKAEQQAANENNNHSHLSTPPVDKSAAQGAKVEPRPLTLTAHTDLVFTWLDAVRKKAADDPLASYVANGANKKRVADLIQSCKNTTNELSRVNAQLAWLAMWNAEKWQNGKSWQDPGMLTIKAFCEHYGDYLDKARSARAKKQAAGSGANQDRTLSGTNIKRWVPPGATSIGAAAPAGGH